MDKSGFLSLEPGKLEGTKLHAYLLGGVAPRPIAFVSSRDKDGNINLSPFSYFNVFGANPPLLIFSPARRIRDNTIKHTLENVREHKEVIVNMVDYAMVEQMSLSSTEYDRGVNEFIKAGLTEVQGDIVKLPRVLESPVAFECVVDQIIESGQEGGAGNLVICKIVKMHFRESILDEHAIPDPAKMDLVGRMGGSWYCRTSKEALFEIPKPLKSKGIGVDMLPVSARDSKVLSGNNLGRLGNLEEIPDSSELDELQKNLELSGQIKGSRIEIAEKLHKLAVKLIEEGEAGEALNYVFLAERYSTD